MLDFLELFIELLCGSSDLYPEDTKKLTVWKVILIIMSMLFLLAALLLLGAYIYSLFRK